MRIIAGLHRSRNLKTLSGDNTRPTSDKVKEAIFSSVGPYFNDNQLMLDLFSGSGSIGLEAISRGMGKVVFNDYNIDAYKIIKCNVNDLKCNDNSEIYNLDYLKLIDKLVDEKLQFDMIFLDPPYHLNAIEKILKLIDDNQLLKKQGVLICESLKKDEFNLQYQNIVKYKEKNYGITKVSYFKVKE